MISKSGTNSQVIGGQRKLITNQLLIITVKCLWGYAFIFFNRRTPCCPHAKFVHEKYSHRECVWDLWQFTFPTKIQYVMDSLVRTFWTPSWGAFLITYVPTEKLVVLRFRPAKNPSGLPQDKKECTENSMILHHISWLWTFIVFINSFECFQCDFRSSVCIISAFLWTQVEIYTNTLLVVIVCLK